MTIMRNQPTGGINTGVRIATDGIFLLADLQIPAESPALVLLAHDGRCRNHPRNQHIAQVIREMGIGTMLCDLLTDEEEDDDDETAKYRNDANLLAKRLIDVTQWVLHEPMAKGLRIGYFGACAAGAAALIAAAKLRNQLSAVVSRGGSMDLASQSLAQVTCPTLLIVGENDPAGLVLNRQALKKLPGDKELQVVRGASHLFGEPGALETMAALSADWLNRHLIQAGHQT